LFDDKGFGFLLEEGVPTMLHAITQHTKVLISDLISFLYIKVVSILASFCVWTKSLKCKDAVNMDSTIQSLQVRRIQVLCQSSERSSHPVRTPICPLFHPSGRRVIPSGR
jgi:hypothetical protein